MGTLVDGFGWLLDPANWSGTDGVPIRAWEHLQLSLMGLVLAVLIAVPLGLFIGHTGKGRFVSVQVANIGRSVPSLAILSLVFLVVVERAPALAFGSLPTIVALTALGVPVILINTYVGIEQVDRDTVEAARGMGMSGWQVLRGLEVPLATPLIMTGIRLAAVQIVATAGLAALIAGGGFGRYVVDGFYLQENDRMVAGAIAIAVLSVLTDLAFSWLAKAVSPRLGSGARERTGPA
jgi:osmoprotectant transport system permease protein